MRVLLDEQIHRRLTERFGAEFEVRAVLQVGWGSLKNGALLRAAEREYDVFVTMDRGIPHQQNVPSLKIGIVVVRAKSNRLEDVLPLVPQIEAALRAAKPGGRLRRCRWPNVTLRPSLARASALDQQVRGPR